MLKRLLFASLFAALTVTMSHALDHQAKIVIPIGSTSPADGKQMYNSYCAPCHGVDGRGHGTASSALKVPAKDLSTLAASNGGKFPTTHLVSVLRYGLDHTAVDMPSWNQIFIHMNHANSMLNDQRTSNLVDYLRTLQVK